MIKPSSLRWRHNGSDGVSNHQPHDCLLLLYLDTDQRKHQSSASLAFVRGIHRGPVNSPHKWQVTRKMLPFDDVIMEWADKNDDISYLMYLGNTAIQRVKTTSVENITAQAIYTNTTTFDTCVPLTPAIHSYGYISIYIYIYSNH